MCAATVSVSSRLEDSLAYRGLSRRGFIDLPLILNDRAVIGSITQSAALSERKVTRC
jgi:hypothetical protein